MSDTGLPRNDARYSEDRVRAEIEEILADPAVPFNEKEGRLEDLAHRLGISIDEAPGDDPNSIDPFRMQIFNALGLLADGGHSYVEQEDDEKQDDPSAPR
ncbi:hypothetical protein [Aureimonas mangrovi]|uniref:hypothetical protein n=1 Tax=Aureimonas mangrovi TaxID=2758041 RepID=UPI00163D48DE|nr:hypothetical protein [Aureimonas mangrovi]